MEQALFESEYPPAEAITITINTLLGGAFLLEVHPNTQVESLKTMLAQIQGIPPAQQTLIYRNQVLSDTQTLASVDITHGSTLTLILKVQTALTSLASPADFAMEAGGPDTIDLQNIDVFDVTGLDDGERDELLSLLFGTLSRALVVCKDGDVLSFFQIQSPDTPEPYEPLDREPPLPLRASSSPAHRDRAVSPGRLRRWQENVNMRMKMANLRTRLRAKKRQIRRALQGPKDPAAPAKALASAVGSAVPTAAATAPATFSSSGAHVSAPSTAAKPSPALPTDRPVVGGDAPRRSVTRAQCESESIILGARASKGAVTDEPVLYQPAPPAGPAPPRSRRASRPATSGRIGTPRRSHADAPLEERLESISIGTSLPPLVVPSARPPPTPRARLSTTSISGGVTLPSLVPARAPSRSQARPRCDQCHRKLKAAASYSCRCGGSFCAQHRYAETHSCAFDYKTEGRKALAAASPLVQAPKLPKI
eukprot:m.30397 g.30397  ORF g.30397 m.30397 type:complete len:481 (+) comp4776_c0_seq1:83-1525(+)